jgi:hypothetical protein
MTFYQANQQTEQMVLTFDVGKWLLDTAVLAAGDLGKATVLSLLTWLADMGVSTQLTFTIPIVQLPNNVEETAVLEPQFVLDEISQAINHAEANLSNNNFAIASGQVETSVIMGNEKGERIQAKITFQIAPQTPQ